MAYLSIAFRSCPVCGNEKASREINTSKEYNRYTGEVYTYLTDVSCKCVKCGHEWGCIGDEEYGLDQSN